MDRNLLKTFENELPNINSLKTNGLEIKIESVYPPDSDTAWASIYTGLSPAKHGIFRFVDPLERVYRMSTEEIDNTFIKGKTFWDIASNSGKKVCLIFPHITYPAWPVNGVMVSRSIVNGEISVYPPWLFTKYMISHLTGLRGLPTGKKDLEKFKNEAIRCIEEEAEFGLKLMKDFNWDLFFIYFSELDWIEHFFWSYFDKEDPGYRPNNKYEGVIKDFYKLFDSVVGKFIKNMPPNTIPIVLSDHGHGRRPTNLFNINEFLRRKGFLKSKIKKESVRDPIFLFEKMKKKIIKFINVSTIGKKIAQELLYKVPSAKNYFTSPLAIDWEKTIAYTTDLSGIKAYTYGGIKINKSFLSESEYENIRNYLINEFLKINIPTGEKLFKWVCKREELYDGKYIEKYPDIIFELKYDWGVGWEVNCSLFSKADTHSIVPGSHKGDSPVFIIGKLNRHKIYIKTENAKLMDIAPTILELLGLNKNDIEWGFDGRSLVYQK